MNKLFISAYIFILLFLYSCEPEDYGTTGRESECSVYPILTVESGYTKGDVSLNITVVDENGKMYESIKDCGETIFPPLFLPENHTYYAYIMDSDLCDNSIPNIDYTIHYARNGKVCATVGDVYDGRVDACVCQPNSRFAAYSIFVGKDCTISTSTCSGQGDS